MTSPHNSNDSYKNYSDWWKAVHEAIPNWKYMTDDGNYRVFKDNAGNVFRIRKWRF